MFCLCLTAGKNKVNMPNMQTFMAQLVCLVSFFLIVAAQRNQPLEYYLQCISFLSVTRSLRCIG